ncbi:MAG: phospho-N-acetylmuramoyl-pentapeptide-transferase [Parachlamydiales bacterium]|nr:phospho-N-acetylmuramoyl-pentapeptide-transferase [Parachlamydiales bacterium]
MLYALLIYLREIQGIKVPLAFTYFSTRMFLATATALLLSIYLGPYFIKKLYELKIGDAVRLEDCPLLKQLHEKKKDTPTMGGVLILFSMLVSLLLWMNLQHIFTLLLFITTICVGLIGAWDDYLKLKYKNAKGLSGKKKLLCQLFIAALIGLYLLVPQFTKSLQMGKWFTPPIAKEFVSIKDEPKNVVVLSTQDYAQRLYVPFIKEPVWIATGVGLGVMGIFFLLVITGSSNAVNLTDGLDGLAAGCCVMAASVLAIMGFISNNIDLSRYLNILYIEGSGEIAIYLSAMVGACLGFLWYNGYPAQVFMGDTGSLPLGAILGVSAVLLKKEIVLAIVGGVFVMEAMSVILQVLSYKYRNKKRIFLCSPIHHHFEYKGWSETKVVIRFWIIAILLAIVGLATIKFQ